MSSLTFSEIKVTASGIQNLTKFLILSLWFSKLKKQTAMWSSESQSKSKKQNICLLILSTKASQRLKKLKEPVKI